MKKVLLTFIILVSFVANAQIQQGLRISNYGGINSVQLNPSSFHYGPLKWDLNIVSGGLFFENEYAYVENTSFFKLLGHNGPFLFRSQSPESQNIPDDPDALYYNFFDATTNMDNSMNAFIGLPSLAFRYKKLSFGIYSNFRTAGAANQMDIDLDYFSLDRWVEGDVRAVEPLQMAGMAWGEIGFNAAMHIKETEYTKWYAGVNLKYLMGFEGFYINSPNESQVTEVADTFLVSGGPYTYGISSGSLSQNGGIQMNGSGLGMDIGVTYIRKSITRRTPYKWRIGASIVDLGYINFDQNAQEHTFNPADLYNLDRNSLDQATDLLGLISIFSEQGLGDPNASLSDTKFTLYTPTMLSLQFDYALDRHWFVGGLFNRRLSLSGRMVDRENLLSVSARYEKQWFEFGLPVTLYDDRHLRMGLWARVYFLTIGSDHLGSLFINEPRFTGSDIYFAIKLNPFSGKRKTGPEDCNFSLID